METRKRSLAQTFILCHNTTGWIFRLVVSANGCLAKSAVKIVEVVSWFEVEVAQICFCFFSEQWLPTTSPVSSCTSSHSATSWLLFRFCTLRHASTSTFSWHWTIWCGHNLYHGVPQRWVWSLLPPQRATWSTKTNSSLLHTTTTQKGWMIQIMQ